MSIKNNVCIEIKELKKSYRCSDGGIKHALKGISCVITSGEVFALLGVNGAGKTTLSSIVAALHPPTSGDVIFQGSSIYKNLSAYREQIGFCPQRPNLDGTLTLEQNLRFAGRYYHMTDSAITIRLKQLVEQFDLGDYVHNKACELSGGYRQRFMIARCLIHSPKIVLLDEPTVGLDPHIRRQLWAKIRELKHEGVTVILTTHYLDEAERLSDRVCIIDKGLIKLIETPEKLLLDFKKNNLEDVFLDLMNPPVDDKE
ncbi:MAG: Daunorubicin resistance ABC transporter ATPase subunit [candidate division TM6 bacterium GW2011_GWF2_36_6]|nr:MAG: Daunorubicin resistance ABC transporter ATPase subunit [candidate division TM6 bacterium GW2011_GWF2_36_6]